MLAYSPVANRRADPGEVVWAQVAFEDDASAVKDRPLLIVGRKDASTVLGLMMSSQPKRPDQRSWLALGVGSWDVRGRPTWVRLDRVLELSDRGIRREGAVLDKQRFADVARELRDRYRWEYPPAP
jgi:hypothetical protein